MKHHIYIRDLSESEYETAVQKRVGDGFVSGDRVWADWFRELLLQWNRIPSDAENRARETGQAMLKLWSSNIGDNLNDIRNEKTIGHLEKVSKPCLIVGRGPSLTLHRHPELLAKFREKVNVVATDGSLPHLFKAGVVPDHVITLDGHPSLVAEFFKSITLQKYAELVAENYGKGTGMKVIAGASIAKTTADAARKLGELYWFIPLWDDYRVPESIVRVLIFMTSTMKNHGSVSFRAGANAGACALTIAFHLLDAPQICLVGLDMGYPKSTSYEETAYYNNAKASGVNMETFQQIMTRFNHPILGESFADPVFRQYRKGMLDLISEIPEKYLPIFNCTEGGTLYGKHVECLRFEDWLKRL